MAMLGRTDGRTDDPTTTYAIEGVAMTTATAHRYTHLIKAKGGSRMATEAPRNAEGMTTLCIKKLKGSRWYTQFPHVVCWLVVPAETATDAKVGDVVVVQNVTDKEWFGNFGVIAIVTGTGDAPTIVGAIEKDREGRNPRIWIGTVHPDRLTATDAPADASAVADAAKVGAQIVANLTPTPTDAPADATDALTDASADAQTDAPATGTDAQTDASMDAPAMSTGTDADAPANAPAKPSPATVAGRGRGRGGKR